VERLEEEETNMTEQQVPCPRCSQDNPPTNRFCGSCGVQLKSGEQLATCQEHSPVQADHAWPAKLGPVSKALVVGVAVLAAEAGLGWLQRKVGAEDRSSVPAVRDADSASRGYLVGLEEVLVGPGRIHVAGLSPTERFDCSSPRDRPLGEDRTALS
jgi:hypothetical protein